MNAISSLWKDKDKRRALLLSIVVHAIMLLLFGWRVDFTPREPEETLIVLNLTPPEPAEVQTETESASRVPSEAEAETSPSPEGAVQALNQPPTVVPPDPGVLRPESQLQRASSTVVPEGSTSVVPAKVVPRPEVIATVVPARPTPRPQVAVSIAPPQDIPQPAVRGFVARPVPRPRVETVISPSSALPQPQMEASVTPARTVLRPEIEAIVAPGQEVPRPQARVAVTPARDIPQPGVKVSVARTVPTPDAQASVALARPVPKARVEATVVPIRPVLLPDVEAVVTRALPRPDVAVVVAPQQRVPEPQLEVSLPPARPILDPQVEAIVTLPVPEPRAEASVTAAQTVPLPQVQTSVPSARVIPQPQMDVVVTPTLEVPSPDVAAYIAAPTPRPIPQATVTQPTSITVSPQTSVVEVQPVVVIPQVSVSPPRSAVVEPEISVVAPRSTRVTPQATVAASRDVVITSMVTVDAPRPVRVAPQVSVTEARSITATSQALVTPERNVTVVAEASVGQQRDITTTPQVSVVQSRSVEVTPELEVVAPQAISVPRASVAITPTEPVPTPNVVTVVIPSVPSNEAAAAATRAPAAPDGVVPDTHIVQSGDTLFDIAVTYNLTVDDLMAINNLDSSLINIGQVLALKRGTLSAELQPSAGEPTEPVAERYSETRLRPLAVLLDNTDSGYPQTGLSEASAVYEMPVEGGLTRLMAIYDRTILSRVGPVRSVRDYFLPLAQELGGILVHDGGSPSAMAAIERTGTQTLNAYSREELFSRDGGRSSPHNLYANSSALLEAAKELRAVTTRTVRGSIYRPDEGAEAAGGISVSFSSSYASNFLYLPEDDLYHWQRNSQGASNESGNAVLLDAVVVARAEAVPIPGDPAGRLYLPLRGGEATLYLSGKEIPGSWSLEGGFHFFTGTGALADLTPFTHWVLFAPLEADVVVRRPEAIPGQAADTVSELERPAGRRR